MISWGILLVKLIAFCLLALMIYCENSSKIQDSFLITLSRFMIAIACLLFLFNSDFIFCTALLLFGVLIFNICYVQKALYFYEISNQFKK